MASITHSGTDARRHAEDIIAGLRRCKVNKTVVVLPHILKNPSLRKREVELDFELRLPLMPLMPLTFLGIVVTQFCTRLSW